MAEAEHGPHKHFFWKITGATGVVYLLGTIHAGVDAMYPLPGVIEESFARSDKLMGEADLESGYFARWLTAHGAYLNGDIVTNHLSPETRTRLAAYLKKTGLPEKLVLRMRPWCLSFVIGGPEAKKMGFSMAKGIDEHFREEALKTHKPIGAVESAEFHLQVLAGLPDDLQDQLVLETLLQVDDEGYMHRLLNAWLAGDPQALEKVIAPSVRDYPLLMKKLLFDRNDLMTAKIEKLLEFPKTYFVTIGAAHLVGAHGILKLLQEKGLTVEQL